MAAPSGTTWGSIAGGYGRVGIYIGTSNTNTQTTITVSTWFWSKYSCNDSNNSYYYNNNATSATTRIGSANISTSVDTGDGWSTSNQVKLAETSYTYNRGTSAVTRNCAVKLTDVDRVGATMTHTRSYTVPALSSYTISYNANGGSGAPSSHTKYYGVSLTLSSAKPTRTGYTFKGWALTKADADDGTWYYQPGGTCGRNENLTLYAVWEENYLTINYYSNYATGAFEDALNTVSSTKNVIVLTTTVYYDNDYSTYGLANYSNSSGSVYMTRTGYTATGNWGTSTSGGTLIDENQGYSSGQAIATALGKDLSNGNASINLYAQWAENALTVNYYSNYATYASYKGEEISVSGSTNVLVLTQTFYYDNSYSSGLADVQNANYLYLLRTGYAPSGYWGTSESGGTLVSYSKSFSTGQALAQALGKTLTSGNVSINIYAQWDENSYTLSYDSNGGYGDISPQIIEWGTTFNLSDNTFTREGYKFIGWNAYRNDDDTWYVIGQGWLTEGEILANGYSKKLYENQCELTFDASWVRENEEARLYTMCAVWEVSGVVYIDNGTTFEPYLTYIDNGVTWDLYLAYIDDGTNWITIS